MIASELREEYFEWLSGIVHDEQPSEVTSFNKLLRHLYITEFHPRMRKDENRVSDAIYLRKRFANQCGYDCFENGRHIFGPCNMLEMMVALAIRCETDIMDDPLKGNRTRQWFWVMIRSLGLSGMTDFNFDESVFDDIMHKFLNRRYSRDGKGGLFTVRNCTKDMRKAEIWVQMLWYLDTIT